MLAFETLNQTCMETSEYTLAQQVRAGDRRAFEILVSRYTKPLFNFIYRMLNNYDLACDVLQEVFIRFYNSFPTLEIERPLKPWLFQVAHNCCIDALRHEKKHVLTFSQLESEDGDSDVSYLDTIPDNGPSADALLDQWDLQIMLQKAIDTLSPRFRTIVLLRYTGQLRFAEIGRMLNMPESTVKTYFNRAKVQLRKVLEAANITPRTTTLN